MTSLGSYIHWHSERSLYAVELKAGLVRQINEEIAAARDLGVETGGVLVGTFPRASELTVRIDQVIPIERRAEDGAEFVLSGSQRERFRAAIREANTRETSAVGFFRSQRGGSLVLSDEDRRISSEEFKNSVHVILLVRAEQPRLGSIYLARGWQAPAELIIPEFGFNIEHLRSSTPLVHPGSALAAVREEVVAPPPPPRAVEDISNEPPAWHELGEYRWGLLAALAVLLMLGAFAAGFLVRPLLPGSKLERELPSSDVKLQLEVTSGADKVLQITWNHRSPDIYKANYGILEIADGLQTRQIRLSRDELETGSVSYERVNENLLITLILGMPDGTTVSEARSWPAEAAKPVL